MAGVQTHKPDATPGLWRVLADGEREEGEGGRRARAVIFREWFYECLPIFFLFIEFQFVFHESILSLKKNNLTLQTFFRVEIQVFLLPRKSQVIYQNTLVIF